MAHNESTGKRAASNAGKVLRYPLNNPGVKLSSPSPQRLTTPPAVVV